MQINYLQMQQLQRKLYLLVKGLQSQAGNSC